MRWGILKDVLVQTTADLADLQAGTGAYTGRPDSVYFTYKQDNFYAQKGDAYVFDKFIGLDLDATRPAEFNKEEGWVAKSFFVKTEDNGKVTKYLDPKTYYLYKNADQIDNHQYWPIFDVNIAASNGSLWNDYAY